MTKPDIIVHMMTSIDGQIDCDMTAQLDGNSEYYSTLSVLETPTRVSGRVTAETEMADGDFTADDGEKLGKIKKMPLLIHTILSLILKAGPLGAEKMAQASHI